jgi:hypothetical protein
MAFQFGTYSNWLGFAAVVAVGSIPVAAVGGETEPWPAGVVASFTAGDGAGFTCCDPLPGGLVCGTTDGRLLLFRLPGDEFSGDPPRGDAADDTDDAGESAAAFTLGRGAVLAVRGLPDGRVTACCASGRWRVWDPRTGAGTEVVESPPLQLAALSPDGARLAALPAQPPIRLHRLDAPADGGRSGRVDTQVRADRLMFSPDGRQLATTRFSRIYLWDAASGKSLRKLRLASNITGAAFFADGERLLVAADHDGLLVLRADTGETIRRMTDSAPPGGDGETRAVAVSPDGSLCLSARPDGGLTLWETYTGRPADRLRGHAARIADAAFLADGRRCVSIDAEGVGYVWDLFTRHRDAADDGSLDDRRSADLWHELADVAGGRGWPALVALSEHPEAVFRVLDDPPDGRRTIPELLRRLDAPDYASRRQAAQGLLRLGLIAEGSLRRFLETGPNGQGDDGGRIAGSEESRRQVGRLLGRMTGPHREAELARQQLAERHRGLRCVHLLKWIGTEDARRRLDAWSRQQTDDVVRGEARRVLVEWSGRKRHDEISTGGDEP